MNRRRQTGATSASPQGVVFCSVGPPALRPLQPSRISSVPSSTHQTFQNKRQSHRVGGGLSDPLNHQCRPPFCPPGARPIYNLPASDAASRPSALPRCLFMTPGARDGGHYERDYTAKQTWLSPQLSLLTVRPGMIGGRTPAGSKRSAALFDHSL